MRAEPREFGVEIARPRFDVLREAGDLHLHRAVVARRAAHALGPRVRSRTRLVFATGGDDVRLELAAAEAFGEDFRARGPQTFGDVGVRVGEGAGARARVLRLERRGRGRRGCDGRGRDDRAFGGTFERDGPFDARGRVDRDVRGRERRCARARRARPEPVRGRGDGGRRADDEQREHEVAIGSTRHGGGTTTLARSTDFVLVPRISPCGPVAYHARLPPKPQKRATLARIAWTLAATLAALLLVRTFVGDVYHVDSGSMEPTLWGAEGGGEWVFVRYTDAPPARQDLVVAQRPDEDAPIVKRVLGLPGESIQIAGGDVLVNGRRIAAADPRPPWVVVYEQGERALGDRFPITAAQRDLWSGAPGVVRLDARSERLDGASRLGVLRFEPSFDDDYLGPDGELVRGTTQARDARVEMDAVMHDVGSLLRIGLSEQNDRFQAVAVADEGGSCRLAIVRRAGDESIVNLASARVDWPLGASRRLTFENRDNVLRFEVAGAPALTVAYAENTFFPFDTAREGRSLGDRVWFGGEQGRFEFRRVRVLRDFSYTDRGTFGVGAPCALGPDEYFLLGDHSSQSRDSRESGPVPARDIVGRPVAVVWPPARWRRVVATTPP